MKAFAMLGLDRVGWIEKPRPECGPLDAIVRPIAVSPCTSDVHTVFEGALGDRRDMILGHEAVGEVVEVGSLVRDFRPGDRVIVKPRFSAFFATQLDLVLRRLGVGTVVLIGTTTPNCIRTTCYDALSLDYNVVLLEDCTSSRTPEVQAANIEDMAFIGAHIMTCDEFCERGLANVEDVAGGVREACFEEAAR